MEETKIQLSQDELVLMQNSDWILTKNRVIEKICQGFGNLALAMQQQFAGYPEMPDQIITSSPKISRGEKYQGLPYVMLDYPRIFGKEDILAIRTLFWWGNYCSITLHVKGVWQEMVVQKMIIHLNRLADSSFYISFSGNEWSHNVLDSDYIKLQHVSQKDAYQKVHAAGFLKIASIVEIGPWIDMQNRLYKLFILLAALIKP